jgi:hypothetical protein
LPDFWSGQPPIGFGMALRSRRWRWCCFRWSLERSPEMCRGIFPASTFAGGIEGKDQVVIASAVATILLAVMLAACAFGAAKAAWRKLRRR